MPELMLEKASIRGAHICKKLTVYRLGRDDTVNATVRMFERTTDTDRHSLQVKFARVICDEVVFARGMLA